MTGNALLTLGLTNAVLATLLALAGWCVTRLWKNPHVASVVWLVVLLKLVTPPLVPLPIAVEAVIAREGEAPAEPRAMVTAPIEEPSRRAAGVSPPSTSSTSPPSTPLDTTDKPLPFTSEALAIEPPPVTFGSFESEQPAFDEPFTQAVSTNSVEAVSTSEPISLSLVLLGLWALGIVVVAGITLYRIVRFRRCLRAASLSQTDVQEEAMPVASRIGLPRCPSICFVEANVGPLVWAGGLTPIVVVPRPLWTTLDAQERETLLAHEFAHIARRDHWVRRFEAIVLALFWWLPTAWYAVRRREAAAESCCDARVLAAYPERPQAYAAALFHAVSLFSTGRPLPLASGLGRITELKERLAMIAHDKVPTRPNRIARMGLLLVALVALAVSTRFVLAKPGDDSKPLGSIVAPGVDQSEVYRINAEIGGGYGMGDGMSEMAADPFGGAYIGEDLEIAEGPSASSDQSAAPPVGLPGPPAAGSSGTSSGSNPFGGRTGSSSRSSSSRRSSQVRPSDAAVQKMYEGLTKIIQSPDEQPAVKVQALRSYGRLVRGTDLAEGAEKVLLKAAENAKDDRTKLAVADALHSLGSAKGVELMWTIFDKSDEEGKNLEARQIAYRMLDNAGAVPPTAKSVRQVAEFVARSQGYGASSGFGGGMPGGMMVMGGFGPGRSTSLGPLNRLTASADGIHRLVAATESIPENDGDAAVDSSAFGGQIAGTGMGGGGMMGAITPRNILLAVLKDTSPANEEIATALVEALTSKDAGVRAAAAEALGNVSEAPVENEEIDMSGNAGKGEKYFELLDRNSDAKASVEELKALQKLRPRFEKAGISLEKGMSKDEFLKAFEKATDEGGLPTGSDLQRN